jgi:hypothetical protein
MTKTFQIRTLIIILISNFAVTQNSDYVKDPIKPKIKNSLKIINSLDPAFSYDKIEKEYTVKISKSIFGDYPAILLNLRENKIFKIYPNLQNEHPATDADLWIEPRDPEISCLESNDKSQKSYLLNVNENYKKINIKYIKNISFKEEDLNKKEIKTNAVFIFKTIKKTIYKLRIDNFSKDKEEMILTYKLIE